MVACNCKREDIGHGLEGPGGELLEEDHIRLDAKGGRCSYNHLLLPEHIMSVLLKQHIATNTRCNDNTWLRTSTTQHLSISFSVSQSPQTTHGQESRREVTCPSERMRDAEAPSCDSSPMVLSEHRPGRNETLETSTYKCLGNGVSRNPKP
eukprot:668314-Rhodomonas_salina.1